MIGPEWQTKGATYALDDKKEAKPKFTVRRQRIATLMKQVMPKWPAVLTKLAEWTGNRGTV